MDANGGYRSDQPLSYAVVITASLLTRGLGAPVCKGRDPVYISVGFPLGTVHGAVSGPPLVRPCGLPMNLTVVTIISVSSCPVLQPHNR